MPTGVSEAIELLDVPRDLMWLIVAGRSFETVTLYAEANRPAGPMLKYNRRINSVTPIVIQRWRIRHQPPL